MYIYNQCIHIHVLYIIHIHVYIIIIYNVCITHIMKEFERLMNRFPTSTSNTFLNINFASNLKQLVN